MKVVLLAGAALAVLVGALIPPAPAADVPSIYGMLARRDGLAVMYVVATEAKEVTTLDTKRSFTLFAPNDDAFKKLDDATIKKIATDKELVRKLLRAHLVEGEYPTTKLKEPDGKELRTRQGDMLKVESLKDGFRVGGAKIVAEDIQCSNGVIHVIDTVLPLKE